jgi:putative copper export protein
VSFFGVEQSDLPKKVSFFPLNAPWTWGEIIALKRFVLGSIVVGNLVISGLLGSLFIPGLWRTLSDKQTYKDIAEEPVLLVWLALFVFVVLIALSSLRVAIKISHYLYATRRRA